MDFVQAVNRIEENLRKGEKLSNFLKNQRLILAISGGLDSTVLFNILNTLKQKGLVTQLALLHVNYGLRGEDSEGDEEFVRSLAKTHDLTIYVRRVHASEKPKNGLGIQEWARDLRHIWFREFVAKGHLICLAHHLDDQVETLLFRMIRGTSARHWMGMQELSGGLWRPLLCFSREELESYQKLYNLPYRVDASNDKITYSRNFLRLQIMQPLEDRFPGAREKIFNLAEEVRGLAEWAETQFETALEQALEKKVLASSQLSQLPEVVQGMMLSRFLKGMLGDDSMLSRPQMNEILNKLHEIKDTLKTCDFTLAKQEVVQVSKEGIKFVGKKEQSKAERANQWARHRHPVLFSMRLGPLQKLKTNQVLGSIFLENLRTESLDVQLFQALEEDQQAWRGRIKELCLKFAVSPAERFRWLVLELQGKEFFAVNGTDVFDWSTSEPISPEKLGLRIRY